MLSYSIVKVNGEDLFCITETTMSAVRTNVKKVYYKKDLSEITVNSDPWRKTIQADRNWFLRVYKPKFDELAKQ